MSTGKFRHVLYLAIAVSMVLYALPRIGIKEQWTFGTLFGVVWLVFALFVISAQLYTIFGVDEEKKRQLALIKREKSLRWEERLQRVPTAAKYRRSKE
ncbi:conserved hypothetical protein [Paenibacillus curdlanolyticus YK9]|uniref:Uncharacterized protein n=1 Tax=Paenibacillus curdlanolyticus YK9 TaxID=717606 RepID=E0IBY8_9BACL|nr:hypothetical protein [Paenibacillus curdlanolyticus]EFM10218.1 conserved hypothetical protein [Paenibacillus curdlanolyticus YK9]